jgi:hypothetical protein
VRFQASMAATPNALAAIGLGRALLNAGKYAEAAAAVAAVPTNFVYLIEHSENTFQNPVWNLSNDNRRFTVLGNEGLNGLDFRTANDPRVQVIRQGTRVGFDNFTPLYEQQKYPNFDADVPLATGIEARLIEAEVQFQAGDTASMLVTLNTLRSAAGMSNLTGPSSLAQARDMVFRERAFWLFSTGHRLGDMRRLTRSTLYGLAIPSVYPEGVYPKGDFYGTDVNLPIPVEEQNNPNFDGCIDRNP